MKKRGKETSWDNLFVKVMVGVMGAFGLEN